MKEKTKVIQAPDWKYLVNTFHPELGQLIDIVFENCNIKDWEKFIDFVHKIHQVKFTLKESFKISFDIIDIWKKDWSF